MWLTKTKSGNKVFIIIFLKKSFGDQPVTRTIHSYIPFLAIKLLKPYILL